jgi:hypothetical protein
MVNDYYESRTDDHVLNHGSSLLSLLRDDTMDYRNLEVDALVASGDCFITLATTLDDLDKSLVEGGQHFQPEIEQVVRTLLYLQRHYKVTKKESNFRQ